MVSMGAQLRNVQPHDLPEEYRDGVLFYRVFWEPPVRVMGAAMATAGDRPGDG